jgi:hypothetical protein
MQEYAELQALTTRAYQLNEEDFAHILSTFPLIPDQVRQRCLEMFRERQ